MERRRTIIKSHPTSKSPSPEVPSEDSSRFHSIARSSREASEARTHSPMADSPTELTPTEDNNFSSPREATVEQIASYRSSRAGSEAPDRDHHFSASFNSDLRLSEEQTASYLSSRAGSEAPPDQPQDLNASVKRANKAKYNVPQGSPLRKKLPRPGVGKRAPETAADAIHEVEHQIYNTVSHSSGRFRYYQLLHYPLETATTSYEPAPPTVTSTTNSKEPSPSPSPRASGSHTGSEDKTSGSPSPCFDEATFNATYDPSGQFLNEKSGNLSQSFSLSTTTKSLVMEDTPQSISALALTTLPDPVSGVPVLGVCLGDCNGYIEYFEVSTSDLSSQRIRNSRSLGPSSGSVPNHGRLSDLLQASSRSTESIDSRATVNLFHDLRGREVARRHNHRAYVKSINALTSVAVQPSVKCLAFVRPNHSPTMISYLTANDRVIKLFHIRRDGFNPLNLFPSIERVVGKSGLGSRYFPTLQPQSVIAPIKEYGPSSNTIQSLSTSADGETFMSVEDLQVFWWSYDAADTTKATCIADLRPPSRALEEVDELVTASSFHPTHSSLFVLSRSSGVLNIGDLRDPPSRDKRQYSITTEVKVDQNPTSCPSYDEILCSISSAAFAGPDHVVTRDYLSLKLWDLRKPDEPCAMVPVMNYVSRYLDHLYDNDSIFDRFPVAVDNISGTVLTGLYDGAVAVWQPLNPNLSVEDSLAYYQVDPSVEPSTANVGQTTEKALKESLSQAWKSSTPPPSPANFYDDLQDKVLEPFANKVFNLAIAPGGERFAYTYRDGRLVHVFERQSQW